MSPDFILSSSNSFIIDLSFQYVLFHLQVKIIPVYFILFEWLSIKIIFLISVLDSMLLVYRDENHFHI